MLGTSLLYNIRWQWACPSSLEGGWKALFLTLLLKETYIWNTLRTDYQLFHGKTAWCLQCFVFPIILIFPDVLSTGGISHPAHFISLNYICPSAMVLIKSLVFRSSVKLWEISGEFGFSSFLLFYTFLFSLGKNWYIRTRKSFSHFQFPRGLWGILFFYKATHQAAKTKGFFFFSFLWAILKYCDIRKVCFSVGIGRNKPDFTPSHRP